MNELGALLSATGNRFFVVDGQRAAAPANPSELARAMCAAQGLDGVLLALPPKAGGDLRMEVYNADGSRAEACGNGLRCVTKLHVERSGGSSTTIVVETDVGPRRVRARLERGRVVSARAELGIPRVEAPQEELDLDGGRVAVSVIDMGNPHAVLFVEDVERTRLESFGPALERHPRFPARVNVELVEAVPDGLRVRIWERGVGETASCGTGVAAAAVAAVRTGRARTPLSVHTRGGTLEVSWDGAGPLYLEGPVEEIPANTEVTSS